jgi:hypothetical protein
MTEAIMMEKEMLGLMTQAKEVSTLYSHAVIHCAIHNNINLANSTSTALSGSLYA